MDFILELVFELVLEGIFGLTVENPSVKTWTKTLVVLLISQAVAGLIFWLAFQQADNVIGIVGLALEMFFLYVIIDGHKRDWKQS